jgi:hypothetical protein
VRAPHACEIPSACLQELHPLEWQKSRLDALYNAAIVADKNAKLSVFATRPGVRSPLFNWIVVCPAFPSNPVPCRLLSWNRARICTFPV